MDLTLALKYGYPNSGWSISENDYSTLSWFDQSIPKPSLAELEAIFPVAFLEQQKNLYTMQLQDIVDKAAAAKGYKDGFACAGYFNSTNVQWAAEAQAFIAWRDAVWEYAHTVLDNSTPENYPTLEQFLANAPQITWPEV